MTDGLIILFGLTMLYLSTTSRLLAHVRTLAIQGLLLFLICAMDFSNHPWYTIAFLTIETLLVKAILIPMFLSKVVKKTHSNRDTDANVAHFYCLLISSLIATLILPLSLSLWASLGAFLGIMILISIIIGTIESAIARLRMSHVFEFVFVMSSLALVVASLVALKLYGV